MAEIIKIVFKGLDLQTFFAPVVQRIECQIPVLMIGVRVPSGAHHIKTKACKLMNCRLLFY